jgi:Amt family ammonium transporter
MESQDIAFIFNTFSFLVNGILVMLMAAGFCMLEAGMVRSKSVATICTKNIVLYSVAGILYFLIGYNLMYSGVDGGFIGSFSLFEVADPATESAEGGCWSIRLVLPNGFCSYCSINCFWSSG